MLTFIPYAAEGEQSTPRERGLLLSSLRSHAAKRSYPWRKDKKASHGRCAHPASNHVSPCHPCNLAPLRPSTVPKRSIDWYFGSLGGSCRKLCDLDVTVLQFYLFQPLNKTMSTEIMEKNINKKPSSKTVARWSPFLQETVQRAIQDSIILDSLLSATILLMANSYQNNESLITAGEKLTFNALRNLRTSIQAYNSSMSISFQMCAVHLCMGALRAGDMTGSQAHLRFLEATVSDFDRRDPYQAQILEIVKFCDIWYALESGNPPSASFHGEGEEVRGGEQHQPKSDVPHISRDRPRSQAVPVQEKQQPARPSHMAPNSSILHALTFIPSGPHQQSHGALFQALDCGLFCLLTGDIIIEYAHAIDYASDPCRHEDTEPMDVHIMLVKCLLIMRRLCSAYSQTQQSPKMTETAVDDIVIPALQIHLVLRMGQFVHPALNKLAGRLRKALLPHSELASRPKSTGSIQDNLYLWTILSGLLATSKASPSDASEQTWLTHAARSAIQAMKITAEHQIETAMAPFLTVHSRRDFGFVRIANELLQTSPSEKGD